MKDRWEELTAMQRNIRKDFWALRTQRILKHIKEHSTIYAIVLFLVLLDLFFRYYTYWCPTC